MSASSGEPVASPNESYESFVQVFARHEPGLRSFVRPLVPTWDDMEEVLQQTCLVLWRKFGEFEQGTDFLSWACTVARFEVLKYRRARARDRHLFGEELILLLADEGAAETNRRERERQALDACIEKLQPRHRDLIRRCYSGASIKEVAESLGRSATSLYKALDRIRLALLECIERSLAQEGCAMSGSKGEGAQAELFSLAAGYCNGTLGTDELARLERLLLCDAEARGLYRRYLGLDAALHDHGESAAPYWRPDDRRRNWKVPTRMLAAAAIAILGAAAALMVVFYHGQPGATPIAALEHVTGDVRILGSDGQVRAIASDTLLSQGDTVRTRGSESSTVLAYADGTRLTLVGNTTVTCGDGRSKSIVVHQGALAASVQPQPHALPMLLATPSAQLQVLGTRFQIEAVAHRTDLSVTEGRVRVVRTSDGKAVDVSPGKHAVVTERNHMLVQDIPMLAAAWEADFEHGLPQGWDAGERVTEGLPPGSRGGVRAVPEENDGSTTYNISSNEAWMQGLFAIRKTSHLHVTFKMEKPKWVNAMIVTRTADPHEPRFSGNYFFRDFPSVAAGQWHTLSVPLAHFERAHRGDVPLEEVVPYKLVFFSDAPDRGLVVDRIWITPDGPGDVVSQRVE